MSTFSKILARLKQLNWVYTVTWHKRSVGADQDPETFEPTITFTDEEIEAIIRPASLLEVQFGDVGEAGEELYRIYTESAIEYKDQITWDSKRFELGPVTEAKEAGYYSAVMKRMVIE